MTIHSITRNPAIQAIFDDQTTWEGNLSPGELATWLHLYLTNKPSFYRLRSQAIATAEDRINAGFEPIPYPMIEEILGGEYLTAA